MDEHLSPAQKAIRAIQNNDPCLWATPKQAGDMLGLGQTTIAELIRKDLRGKPDGLPSRLDHSRRLLWRAAIYDRMVTGVAVAERRNGFRGVRPHEMPHDEK
jgi:hypothetical protein